MKAPVELFLRLLSNSASSFRSADLLALGRISKFAKKIKVVIDICSKRAYYEYKAYVINLLKEEFVMPRGDGTGPMGQGPLTGRKMGQCGGGQGMGMGQGRGLGRGMGRGAGQGFGQGAGRGAGQGLGQGNRGAFAGQDNSSLSEEELLQEKKMLQQRLETINKDLEKR